MSQENIPLFTSSSPRTPGSISLTISNPPLPNPSSWSHIAVSLSPRKQSQIMEGINLSHSTESRFSTWSVVGAALSTTLLSGEVGLYVQSHMELHRKDFLLYTRKNSERGDGIGGIIEVDFVKKIGGSEWEGHWQEARPALASYVRESFEQWQRLEKSREQGGSELNKEQGAAEEAGESGDVEESARKGGYKPSTNDRPEL